LLFKLLPIVRSISARRELSVVILSQEQQPFIAPAGDLAELAIVMPCLNEAETVGICVRKAHKWMQQQDVDGEVIIADNGSSDASQALAEEAGARVVSVEEKGYGSALMGGIAAARSKYVIMGDADDSYDFSQLTPFLVKLREGYDLVQGCRLPSGGGIVSKGAMPLSHRWLGNPMFSFLARHWFQAPVHDIYCGMRGFTRSMFGRLDQRCTGMEFATEMIIKASLNKEKIAEVPITLHPDGRKTRAPHLKTFRDGWRTLRLFLICSPRWLFLIPGLGLIFLGGLGYAIALPGMTLNGVTFDAHTLLFASLAVLCGYQAVVFAVLTKMFATTEGLLPPDPRLENAFKYVTLETGLVGGAVALLAGCALLLTAVLTWKANNWGRLDYSQVMRVVIPGATLTALGFQTVLFSFFMSILGMKRK
jgi:glycosyltransferase involved in cell wall biosynthesis